MGRTFVDSNAPGTKNLEGLSFYYLNFMPALVHGTCRAAACLHEFLHLCNHFGAAGGTHFLHREVDVPSGTYGAKSNVFGSIGVYQ